MITGKNIADFYKKYRNNIEKEKYLNDSLLKAEDEESWIERVQEKSVELRKIYNENETMLNLYLRPVLEQEELLTEEVAEELYAQLLTMDSDGYCDRLVCVEVGEALRRFFEKWEKRDQWIKINSVLGGFYSRYSGIEDADKSLECFSRVRKCIAEYEQIEDWAIRRVILFSFYNCAIVWNNSYSYRELNTLEERTAYQKKLLREVERAEFIYDDPTIREMDGDKYDLDGLKDELDYDVYGCFVCGCDSKEEIIPEMMQCAKKAIESLYEAEIEKNVDPHEIRDEIYCNYWKLRYYLGEVTLEEYVSTIMSYCDTVLERGYCEEDGNYVDSRYFQVNMYHIPNLAAIDGLKENPKLYGCVKAYILPRFTSFVEHLPRSENAVFINGPLRATLFDLAHSIGTEGVDISYFLNVLLNREEHLAIDAAMVKRLSLTIQRKMCDKKSHNELLVISYPIHLG